MGHPAGRTQKGMSLTDVPEIHGSAAAGFEPVREAFAANFTDRGELGAAVAVRLNGRTVVDLRGGWADPERSRAWAAGTLTNVWSTTKGMTAICALRLAETGDLDVDDPVVRYWPEFGQAGKETIPVRWLLSHRSGVTGVGPRHPLQAADLHDWEKMTRLLAAQEPLFEPGTVSGYQALAYGYLVGEVIRRITGQTVGAFFAEHVARPLGADFHIGLEESDLDRCSIMVEAVLPPEVEAAMAQAFAEAGPAALAALANPRPLGRDANDANWRRAEIPAANGHGTALAVATIYGALADGSERLLKQSTMELGRTGQGWCVDAVAGAGNEFGLGFTLGSRQRSFGPNPRAFGHDGFGGSTGFADPESGLSLGYVMNQMGPGLRDDPRKMALIDACYACLG
jgi:CubicO group peptidase (beta-lactamase class C family)